MRTWSLRRPLAPPCPEKLFEISADITADHKKHVVLDMPFHGWFGLSPYLDTPSERVFWVLQRAGVKWILADGSGGGINPLLDPGDVIIPDDLIDQTKRVSYLSKFTDKIVRMQRHRLPGPGGHPVQRGAQGVSARLRPRRLRGGRGAPL